MAGRFVRSSKYRHVFGRSTKKELCYDNLHISKNAWDSNIIKANPQYLSVNWESGGGGAFAVIPLSQRGRLPEIIPLFRGHTAAVLDTDWSPFNDSLIASGSDDGKVFIWTVPENFSVITEDDQDPKDVAPVSRLAGHTRKVGHVMFHPSAENVLASSSGDYSIKLWDISTGQPNATLKHNDIVQSMSWSTNGSLLVTTCRDKKIRVWDARQEKPAHEVPGHAGAKNSRAVWMHGVEGDRFATTGFSKMSDRQLALWDLKTLSDGPIGDFQMLDSISGVCMPFWDEGTKCIYLAGKGDGNIRYYEYSNDEFIYLSEYKSGDPQRGVAFLPKRGVSVHENEVMRAFKTVNDSYIEPISFIVPRRAETFQDDIYPPAPSGEPALTAEQWFGGADAEPPMFSMESLYSPDGESSTVPKVTAKPFAPVATSATAPSPMKASPVVSAPEPKPVSIPEPVKSAPSPVKPTPAPEPIQKTDPPTAEAVETPQEPVRPKSPVKVASPEAIPSPVKTPAAPPPTAPTSASVETENTNTISEQLSKITSLLEIQNKTLVSQNAQIADLTRELDTLKSKVNSDGDSGRKDEIIRKLELELEEARS